MEVEQTAALLPIGMAVRTGPQKSLTLWSLVSRNYVDSRSI
jgi:hypothetical protein